MKFRFIRPVRPAKDRHVLESDRPEVAEDARQERRGKRAVRRRVREATRHMRLDQDKPL